MIQIDTVMVPSDFSEESTLAVKFGASIAQQYKSKVYLIHVLEPIPANVKAELADAREFDQRRRDAATDDLKRVIPHSVREGLDVEEIVETGRPVYHVIVEKARELGVEVIVIATHGRSGLAHILLGSVAEKVIRYAPCPVFVVRNP